MAEQRKGPNGTQGAPRCSRRAALTLAGAAGVASLTGCLGRPSGDSTAAESMTIFHAGSLGAPFEAAESKFERKHDIQLTREAKGSVGSTKKITQQGRKASVLGVSDFRLLRDRLLPEFGSWYAVFATNAMTIVYTDSSTGASEIGTDNWWEILARDDVEFAHSDPAIDPNGYRSVMAMQLGTIPFEGEKLYGKDTYRTLREKAIIPTGTETELIAQLQTGKLDYAWEYLSAGATHDVKTVELQSSIDLSKTTPKHATHYAKASVETESGTFTGAPIAYGIAVPDVAPAPRGGALWVEYVLTEPGKETLEQSGFAPTDPAVVPKAAEDVPKRVRQHATARKRLGPLEL